MRARIICAPAAVRDVLQDGAMPRFWIAMQLVILACILASAVIVIVKL